MTRARLSAMMVLVLALGVFQASPVSAQTTVDTPDRVDADIKGTVGLGLIGAEIGLLMPGITGLTDAWAWSVFPAVGAAGGVVAGIFAFEKRDGASPKAAVATLGVGLGLVIPATVLALSLANKRVATEEYTSARQRRQLAAMRAGDGLVRVSPEGTFVRAPGVTPVLQRRADGSRDRGTLVSLVSGRF